MAVERRSVRVFISSPDDVKDEREATRRVIRRLAHEFRDEFDLDEVMWEWQPLLAGQHFQAQITPPRDTDITVVVLWSRLGTPLPIEHFPGPLTKGAVTGTEWEFEDAIASMRARQAPQVLMYRKRGAYVTWHDDQRREREEGERQLRLVESFFGRWFASHADGNVDVALRTFRTTAEFEPLVEEHLRALLKQRLRTAAATIRWHAGSPYRGLQSFEPQHAEIFFGRAAPNQALRERLERRLADRVPFVVVLGASGSGKSSLVKAGLIPSLERGSWIGRIGVARRAVLSPTDDESDPLTALARALLSPTALPELGARGFGDAAQLAGLLRESPTSAASLISQALRDIAAAHPPRADQRAGLVIVVDQLEELFTTPFSDDARLEFIDVLETLARASVAETLPGDAPPFLVVATMRSDFYGQLDRLPNLAALIEGDGQLLLLAPDEHEIGQMIRMPAEIAGLHFERDAQRGLGLDDEILSVAQRDTRVLPLLSFVLDRLWQQRAADGALTFEAYRALGGLEGALARRADEVVDALPPDVQAALPNVLGALVHVASARTDESRSSESGRFTARWLPLERFAARSPERRLVDALLDPNVRLLVAEGDRDEVRLRVAHEALLTHWQRARDILEADRSDLALIERLEEAERLWRDSPEHARADRLLPAGLALAEAVDVLLRRRDRLAPPLVEFVELSERAEHERVRRRARRARRLVSVFAMLTLVASVLGLFVWRKSDEANAERDRTKVANTALRQQAREQKLRGMIQDLARLRAQSRTLDGLERLGKPAYQWWIEETERLLAGQEEDLAAGKEWQPGLRDVRAKIAELRASDLLLPYSDEERQRDLETHPERKRLLEMESAAPMAEQALKGAVAELEIRVRAHALRLGKEPWPSEPDIAAKHAAELESSDASTLNELAWPLVDPDETRPGAEDMLRAMLLAKRAVDVADAADKAMVRDTYAWSLLWLGRDAEALAQSEQALAEAQGDMKTQIAANVERLRAEAARWSDSERAAREAELAQWTVQIDGRRASLESDIAAKNSEWDAKLAEQRALCNERRTWRFAESQFEWWHALLVSLESDLSWQAQMLEVAREAAWSEKARARWAEAIDAIAKSPKYAGQRWPSGARLTPQLGLLPLGENPATGLWEFVHLQTGTEPRLGSDGRALRDAEGRLTLTPATGVVFVLLPGGRVPKEEGEETGQLTWITEVDLAPFFLSKYEMTHEQWDRVSLRRGLGYGNDHELAPANMVSWDDVSPMWSRELGWCVLPSEAQWEYGCRAGTSTRWWSGDDARQLVDAAHIDHDKSDRTSDNNLLAIGRLRSNAFGLHDVYGNVWEACGDTADLAPPPREGDGLKEAGVNGSTRHPFRGGGWSVSASLATSVVRADFAAGDRSHEGGLRPSRRITP